MRALLPLFLVLAACADADGDGYATPDDCDDGDPTVFPDAQEACNGIDDDCDGQVDEPVAEGAIQYYLDEDGDGWGTARKDRNGDGDAESTTVVTCEPPFGYSDRDGDCDDDDAAVNPDDGGC